MRYYQGRFEDIATFLHPKNLSMKRIRGLQCLGFLNQMCGFIIWKLISLRSYNSKGMVAVLMKPFDFLESINDGWCHSAPVFTAVKEAEENNGQTRTNMASKNEMGKTHRESSV